MVNVASSSLTCRVDHPPPPLQHLQLACLPVLLRNHRRNNLSLLTIPTLLRLSFPFFPPGIGNV